MITRIVKLTIDPTKKEDFIAVFNDNKEHIKGFDGCLHLELLQNKGFDNIFFTYSKWESVDKINAYRSSELFGKVWKKTKATFCAPPQAWSVDELFAV